MKKLITCILTVFCFLLISGCAGNNTPAVLPPSDSIQPAEATDTQETTDTTSADVEETAVTPASSDPADVTASADSSSSGDSTVNSGSVVDPVMAPQPAAAETYIGEETAKVAALEHAGLNETDLTFIRAYLDWDDGRTVYDIEFYQGNTEYDYEIDAVSGAILSFDFDIENYTVQPAQDINLAQGEISLDEAKSIALTKVNLTADQVVFTETSFEYDDGIAVYQIDFWAGNMEYEFEINAANGTILEYDAEY